MKITPTYFKKLAETRARSAGDVERYRTLLEEIAKKLAKAEAEVLACDLLIKKVRAELDPSVIPPIRGHWRYGQRGRLREEICAYLDQNPAAEVSTTELSYVMQARFSIDFESAQHRKRWVHNSLANALKALLRDGRVVRVHDPKLKGRAGRWRSPIVVPSVDPVRMLAVANGVPVLQADAAEEVR